MTTKKTNTLSPAAASREALADAKAKAETWATDHAAATEAAEKLIARLSSGDDSVTAAALTAAEFEAKRAGLLADAGSALVSRAELALINDDQRLAELFADVLGEAFGWLVPVRVVTVAADVTSSLKGEPVLFLLQDKAATDDGGILSGELRLTFFRSALLAPLDVERIGEAAAKRGYSADVIPWGTAERGDQHHDTALIRVHEAAPEVPVLAAAPADEAVRHFARGVTGRLQASVRAAAPGVHLIGDGPSPNATAELVSHRVEGKTASEDGERITVSLTCRVSPSPSLKGNPLPRLRGTVDRLTGVVEPGIGRVVSVEDVQFTAPDRPQYRQPWTVTARVVIAYRVAAA